MRQASQPNPGASAAANALARLVSTVSPSLRLSEGPSQHISVRGEDLRACAAAAAAGGQSRPERVARDLFSLGAPAISLNGQAPVRFEAPTHALREALKFRGRKQAAR